jgi:hypothetical protein
MTGGIVLPQDFSSKILPITPCTPNHMTMQYVAGIVPQSGTVIAMLPSQGGRGLPQGGEGDGDDNHGREGLCFLFAEAANEGQSSGWH